MQTRQLGDTTVGAIGLGAMQLDDPPERLERAEPTMRAAPSHYQTLSLQGNPASATSVTGEIVVDALSLGGNSIVRMNLNPLGFLTVRKVALVR